MTAQGVGNFLHGIWLMMGRAVSYSLSVIYVSVCAAWVAVSIYDAWLDTEWAEGVMGNSAIVSDAPRVTASALVISMQGQATTDAILLPQPEYNDSAIIAVEGERAARAILERGRVKLLLLIMACTLLTHFSLTSMWRIVAPESHSRG